MNKQKIAWILHEVFTNPANHGPRGLPGRHYNIIIKFFSGLLEACLIGFALFAILDFLAC